MIPRTGLSLGVPIRGINSPVVTAVCGDQIEHIRRASHVEPTQELSPLAQLELACARGLTIAELCSQYKNQWWADMHLSGGDILGPYPDRPQALAAEHEWLLAHHIPYSC